MSATDTRRWFLRSQGRVRGPFTLDALRIERDRHRLKPTTELSLDRRTWAWASTLTELFPPGSIPTTERSAPPPPPPVPRVTRSIIS